MDDADRPDQLIHLRSAGVKEPSRANERVWVSRFSIPIDSRGGNIVSHLYLALEAADQLGTTGLYWNRLSHRLPVFYNDDAGRIEMVRE